MRLHSRTPRSRSTRSRIARTAAFVGAVGLAVTGGLSAARAQAASAVSGLPSQLCEGSPKAPVICSSRPYCGV